MWDLNELELSKCIFVTWAKLNNCGDIAFVFAETSFQIYLPNKLLFIII